MLAASTPVGLVRAQFATPTTTYHFPFVPLTLGLGGSRRGSKTLGSGRNEQWLKPLLPYVGREADFRDFT